MHTTLNIMTVTSASLSIVQVESSVFNVIGLFQMSIWPGIATASVLDYVANLCKFKEKCRLELLGVYVQSSPCLRLLTSSLHIKGVSQFLYLELASAVICNRKSAVLNVGKWDIVEHQRVLQLTWLILPIRLVFKLDVLFTI